MRKYTSQIIPRKSSSTYGAPILWWLTFSIKNGYIFLENVIWTKLPHLPANYSEYNTKSVSNHSMIKNGLKHHQTVFIVLQENKTMNALIKFEKTKRK